jgi:shikimate 5-dehydrogenase
MTEREVTDADGTTWSCVQAFSGTGAGGAAAAAAAERVAEGEGRVAVVATPRGGAQSVRLELPRDWHESMSDEELAAAIQAER